MVSVEKKFWPAVEESKEWMEERKPKNMRKVVCDEFDCTTTSITTRARYTIHNHYTLETVHQAFAHFDICALICIR